MTAWVNPDHLAHELRPYLAGALEAGPDLLADIGSELSKKATGGLTSLGVNAATSIIKAIKNRRERSKAWRQLAQEWAAARNEADRERAIRKFLARDPVFKASVEMLLIRRDFVRAMLIACERLPFVESLGTEYKLSDVYVPTDLAHVGGGDKPSPGDADYVTKLLESEEGQHLVEGIAGSGKSVFARRSVAIACHRLLNEQQTVAFDQLRLPVYVSARDLAGADFTSSLHRAVAVTLGPLAMAPLPDRFFVPYAENGHHRWLIVIDALDEVDHPRDRGALWDAVTQMGATRTFSIGSRAWTGKNISGMITPSAMLRKARMRMGRPVGWPSFDLGGLGLARVRRLVIPLRASVAFRRR